MSPADLATLERSAFFRRTVWKRNALLAAAVLLNLVVLAYVACLHVSTFPHEGSYPVLGYHVYLAVDSWQSYFWLAVILVVQVVLAHYALRKSLEGDGMVPLYPEDKSNGRKFGGLTGPRLTEMVHDLARDLHAGTVKRVVVSDRPDPNAYTAHVLGLGNIVVLHANLLEILPPDGVRAIVAHEVGHIRRRDSLVYLVAGIPMAFLWLLSVLILWKVGVGIFRFDNVGVLAQRVAFLFLVWSVTMWVLLRLNRVANLASQQSEHLADAYAAAACGWGPTLNALLLLGERCEALTALTQTLEKLPHLKGASFTEEQVLNILKRFPARELNEKKAREVASRVYIESRLAELKDTLCVPLSDDQIIELSVAADRALRKKQADEDKEDLKTRAEREKEEQAKEVEVEELLINWRKYDWDQSGHLDPHETAALVVELRGNPAKMIFRQFLEPEARWESHPTMRGRLLYLHEAFQQAQPQ